MILVLQIAAGVVLGGIALWCLNVAAEVWARSPDSRDTIGGAAIAVVIGIAAASWFLAR